MTRLIDADALDRAMYHKSFEVDDGRNVWNSGLWIRYKIYEEASREAPTIDAEPVRHGKWIEEIGMFMCSECGDAWSSSDAKMIFGFNYCPNCGAKMESEHETD